MDVMLVRQPRLVLPVSPDMKATTVADALRAVLDLTLSSTVTLVSPVLMANTRMQHRAFVRLVQAIVKLALL